MSGFDAAGAADDSAILVLDDGVTASECGQRADGIKGMGAGLQALPAAFELRLYILLQALAEVLETCAEVLDAQQRLMALQFAVQAIELQLFVLYVLSDAALQALFEFIKALTLL